MIRKSPRNLFQGIVGILLSIFCISPCFSMQPAHGTYENKQVETLLLSFYANYVSDYDFTTFITIPDKEKAVYAIGAELGESASFILHVKGAGTGLKILHRELNHEQIRSAGKMIASEGLDLDLNGLVAKVQLVKNGVSYYTFYPKNNAGLQAIFESDDLKLFITETMNDAGIIQDAINSLSTSDEKTAYQSMLNSFLATSFRIHLHRTRTWNTYNRQFGPNLQRAIVQALPGVKSQVENNLDEELENLVNQYIQGTSTASGFDASLNSYIRSKVEESTRYDIENTSKRIRYQVDYIVKDIEELRKELNKFGGGRAIIKNISGFDQLAELIPEKQLKETYTSSYDYPDQLTAFLSSLPEVHSPVEPDISSMSAQVQNAPSMAEKVEEIEPLAKGTMQAKAAAIIPVIKENIPTNEASSKGYDEDPVIVEVEPNAGAASILTETSSEVVTVLQETLPDTDKAVTSIELRDSMEDRPMQDETEITSPATIYRTEPQLTESIRPVFRNLQQAILMGETNQSIKMIQSGTDFSKPDINGFYPIHIATILDNTRVVNELLMSGVNIDTRTRDGYTPLHITSELGNYKTASLLLLNKADRKFKTEQGLSSKDIVGIESDKMMKKVFRNPGKYSSYSTSGDQRSRLIEKSILFADENSYEISLDLSYNEYYLKQRQRWKSAKWISIPVFLLSSSASAYLHYKAEDAYRQYEASTTNEDAIHYYDLTGTYDNLTYISAGVATVSLYFTISSGIKVSRAERNVRKDYY